MAVPSFFVGVLDGSPEDLPSGRPQVRDRHLKFHEDRDNLRVETRRLSAMLDAFVRRVVTQVGLWTSRYGTQSQSADEELV
jgi:hypothetical protein